MSESPKKTSGNKDPEREAFERSFDDGASKKDGVGSKSETGNGNSFGKNSSLSEALEVVKAQYENLNARHQREWHLPNFVLYALTAFGAMIVLMMGAHLGTQYLSTAAMDRSVKSLEQKLTVADQLKQDLESRINILTKDARTLESSIALITQVHAQIGVADRYLYVQNDFRSAISIIKNALSEIEDQSRKTESDDKEKFEAAGLQKLALTLLIMKAECEFGLKKFHALKSTAADLNSIGTKDNGVDEIGTKYRCLAELNLACQIEADSEARKEAVAEVATCLAAICEDNSDDAMQYYLGVALLDLGEFERAKHHFARFMDRQNIDQTSRLASLDTALASLSLELERLCEFVTSSSYKIEDQICDFELGHVSHADAALFEDVLRNLIVNRKKVVDDSDRSNVLGLHAVRLIGSSRVACRDLTFRRVSEVDFSQSKSSPFSGAAYRKQCAGCGGSVTTINEFRVITNPELSLLVKEFGLYPTLAYPIVHANTAFGQKQGGMIKLKWLDVDTFPTYPPVEKTIEKIKVEFAKDSEGKKIAKAKIVAVPVTVNSSKATYAAVAREAFFDLNGTIPKKLYIPFDSNIETKPFSDGNLESGEVVEPPVVESNLTDDELPNVDEEVSPKIENGTMQGNGEDKST